MRFFSAVPYFGSFRNTVVHVSAVVQSHRLFLTFLPSPHHRVDIRKDSSASEAPMENACHHALSLFTGSSARD